MEYLVKYCPKCNGELRIPPDMKKCICMYCGETFEVQETESGNTEITIQAARADYKLALENIALLLDNFNQYMENFTKKSYSTSFENYVQTGIRVIQPIESYASLSKELYEEAVTGASRALVEEVKRLIDGGQNGSKKRQKRSVRKENLDRYQYFFAVYTIPMIRYLGFKISEPLADGILANWRMEFPKNVFQKGSYEEIQAGFNKKSFFGLKF